MKPLDINAVRREAAGRRMPPPQTAPAASPATGLEIADPVAALDLSRPDRFDME
jgi:hypothetical protein